MDTENHTHPILKDIEAYCEERGMKPCTFGKSALGDPSLVSSLRLGREPRRATVSQIKHYLLTGQRAVSARRKSSEGGQ